MNRRRIVGSVLVIIAVGVSAAGFADAGELAVGDTAPPFTLQGSDGRTYSLDQFRGEKAVVLAWFPKAFTGG